MAAMVLTTKASTSATGLTVMMFDGRKVVGVRMAQVVVLKMLVEMWVKMEGATRSRPSSGRRRLEGPASPLWSLAAYQIQELEIVGGGVGVGEEAHQVDCLWLPKPRRLVTSGSLSRATIAAALTRSWWRGLSRGR